MENAAAADYGALLERIRGGEPAALTELVAHAEGIARRYSTAVCGDAPDRDDAMQEALLQTFRHAASIQEPQAFRAWLYRVVKNACLLGRRRHDQESALPESGEPAAAGDPAARILAAVDVRRALAALPPSYREVVFLRELEGLSTREVADVLDISEANVKVRLHRAHQHLRSGLAGATARDERPRSSRRSKSP